MARTATSRCQAPETMLDIDVAGLAHVSEGGIEIERAPEGITFEPLGERRAARHARRRRRQVHGAQRGELAARPARPRAEGRRAGAAALRARSRTRSPDGSLFWRLLVVAEEGSRFTLIEEYASASPDLAAYSNAAVELFVEQGAKLEYVSLQNLSRETWHFATHHARVERDAELDWVAGGFGSKKGKTRIQNDLAGQGATSRVTGAYFADGEQHLDYDTFQEHIAPHTTSDFAFKGALARPRDDGLARDDPRRAGRRRRRTPTRRTATCCSPRTRTPTRSPASRSSPTTSAAPTARRSARSTASSSST